MYLAGDVGGTKTHLAIFDEHSIIEDRIYTSHEYDGLEPIILDFLKFQGRSLIKYPVLYFLAAL